MAGGVVAFAPLDGRQANDQLLTRQPNATPLAMAKARIHKSRMVADGACCMCFQCFSVSVYGRRQY